MKHSGRAIAGVVILAIAAGGCGTITGRPFSQYFEDMKTTAKVKTRLATQQIGSLTRTNVDTYNGVVYLNGVVDSENQKERLERAAAVRDRHLVSHLQLRRDGSSVARADGEAASPRIERSNARSQAHLATINGQVTSVDRNAGTISVKTDDGNMHVQVPRSAVQNLKEGDHVSVSLATEAPEPNATKTNERR